MWLMVMYDLPAVSMKQKNDAKKFRKGLIKDGFKMFQYSVYVRYCFSEENIKTHERRIKKLLINGGNVNIIQFTDKQFSEIYAFKGKNKYSMRETPELLTFC